MGLKLAGASVSLCKKYPFRSKFHVYSIYRLFISNFPINEESFLVSVNK